MAGLADKMLFFVENLFTRLCLYSIMLIHQQKRSKILQKVLPKSKKYCKIKKVLLVGL
jgi:hypothetical protein